MSDKPRDRLNPLDLLIRENVETGQREGDLLKITFIGGFELFNTRNYHNYEPWSQGYRVEGDGVTAQAEDLDDALRLWVLRKQEKLSIP